MGCGVTERETERNRERANISGSKNSRLLEAKELRDSERHLLLHFTDILTACRAVNAETSQQLPLLEDTIRLTFYGVNLNGVTCT